MQLIVVYHLVPTSNHNSIDRNTKGQLLFIILFLHQTTTSVLRVRRKRGCLSSCSYIKPQLRTEFKNIHFVVYHLVPTSNHNTELNHSLNNTLFIILFLHQTTTMSIVRFFLSCCLSSCSYIKPQPPFYVRSGALVVYHLVPTSNHNNELRFVIGLSVVYHLVPTSNHN